MAKEVQRLAIQLDHQTERERWREAMLRQAEEIERLQQENRQLSEQKDRPALPPTPSSTKSKKSSPRSK